MSTVTLTGLLLGVLLGMRHALEPDHIAAVSTLVLESGSSRRGMLLGAFWGIGHSLALLSVGCLLALLHAELPGWLGEVFELAVAVMLIALGLRAVTVARQKVNNLSHSHSHQHGHTMSRPSRALASRPLAFGVIHGLAGSGALTALVVAELPSTASRVTYISLFGFGSIVGMAALSGLAGWPLQRLGRQRAVAVAISLLTGALSFGLGVALLVPLAAHAMR
jgi:hypothetical protein